MKKWIAVPVVIVLGLLLAWWWPSSVTLAQPARERFTGVIRDDARVLAGARVDLLIANADQARPIEIAHASTTADGSYELVVPPQRGEVAYFLRASAPDHAANGRQVLLAEPRQNFILASAAAPVAVRVIDEAGAPVVGAEVTLAFVPRSGDATAVLVATASSTANGEVAFLPLMPVAGEVRVEATKPHVGSGVATVVKSAGIATVAIEVVLDEGATLRLHTVDRAGRPVDHVPVRVAHGDRAFVATAQTDHEGRAELADVPTGGHLELRPTGEYVLDGPSDTQTYAIPPGAALHDVTIVVEPGGAIQGRVVSWDGVPLAGVAVNAQTVDHEMTSARRAVTDDDGRFRIDNLRKRARWDLDARKPGFAPAFASKILLGDAGTLVMSSGGSLAGRVVTTDRAPQRDVEVYLHATMIDRNDPTLEVGGAEYAQVRTAADGTWSSPPLNPGRYRVEVRGGPAMQWDHGAGVTLAAEVVAGERRDLGTTTIALGATLVGTIAAPVEAANLHVGTVEVQLLPVGESGAPHVVRAQLVDRRFQIANLVAGNYSLTVRHRLLGFSTSQVLALTAGRESVVSIPFTATTLVTGRVLDPSGAPLIGAKVDVFSTTGAQASHPVPGRAPDNTSGNFGFTDEQGAFAIAGLSPGSYLAVVSIKNAVAHAATWNIDRSPRPLTLQLPRRATLHVTVPGRSANVTVMLETEPGEPFVASATAVSDPSGVAHVRDIPPGRYRVKAITAGIPDGHVELAAGADRTLELSTP